MSTLAGTGKEGYTGGEWNVAHFNFPTRVAVDGGGNGIVADSTNHIIRKVTPATTRIQVHNNCQQKVVLVSSSRALQVDACSWGQCNQMFYSRV